MKGSWKTTTAGILAIFTASVGLIANPLLDNDPATIPHWAEFISIAIAGVTGLFARDNNVSSEEAGAK
jgi:hypothetical protein